MGKLMYFSVPFLHVRISISAIIFLTALFIADFSYFTVIILISAALHEYGHVATIRLCGGKVYGITLLPFGAVIDSDSQSLSYKKNAMIALSGVLSNIFVAVVAFVFYLYAGDVYSLFTVISNLLLAGVNIVPVKGFDGGVALESILLVRYSCEKVSAITETVTYFAFVFLAFGALALLVYTGCNFSLTIFCIYVYMSVYSRREV